MRRELAPLLLVALRASGASGPHAATARHVVLLVLIAQMLAAAEHDGPPHAAARAPRHARGFRTRFPHRDSLTGRRPRG